MLQNKNYDKIFERFSDDLNSNAYLLRHKKSGARIFILSNDDDNKVFYIAFRTPPKDSTGVAHIMEHSTLCGSEKFPLKDPFVELAKGSLNTFLNAMTYPDKTVYPVASCNDKDFRNLQDVYLDAVFHPNVYKHPEIMKQEGWSYHIEDPDSPIEYNGVVYNEMKGAFSSPDEVLMRQNMNSLFPDTTYGVESGGDPEHIPDLTYEQFLDFHRKNYHPSNSYIYLYGNIDIEEQLEWLDREYLCKYDIIETDSKVEYQKPFEKMQETVCFYPITDEENEEDNTYLSYNTVCGDSMDVKLSYAMQMLSYALVDTQGSPIRTRLLDAGIGNDISSMYDESLLQPYFSITAKNANEDQKDQFVQIITEELERAASGALNKRSLAASLNSLKFKYREADFGGYPKGLIYGLTCLNSWLYDDEQPLLHLELEKVFAELEKDINTDYFEKVISELLLGSRHSSLVILKPKKGMASDIEERTEQKLAAFKESLSREQVEDLIAQTKALAEYQEKQSTEEELETIPLLERSDISRDVQEAKNVLAKGTKLPMLEHEYETNGIAYINLFFDCNDVDKHLLPYVGLLKSFVSFVDTEHYTYSEINDEINTYTGGFGMEAGIYCHDDDKDKNSIMADLSVRVLYENIDKAFDLIEDVLFKSRYDDAKRVKEIIAELKSKLQVSITSSGHVAAGLRAASYYSKNALLKEQINGIEFYKFVEGIEKDIDGHCSKIAQNIEKLMRLMLAPGKIFVNCTARREGLDLIKQRLEGFTQALREFSGCPGDFKAWDPRESSYDLQEKGLTLQQKNEAFKTSGSVNYVARAGRYAEGIDEFTGAVNVADTIMRYEYLWFNIRVQGGAYGCMSTGRPNGELQLLTYRDPNIRRSNDVFEGVPEYLENFDCDEREMTKYVIGTVGNMDTPLTPAQKGARDFGIYFKGYTTEERKRIKSEVIDCCTDDIRAVGTMYRAALSQNNICCVGTQNKIDEDRELFKNVRNLFE